MLTGKVNIEEFTGQTAAEKIRFIRAQLDISRQQLADIAHVSVATVVSWETSGYPPGDVAVAIIAKHINIPADWLRPVRSIKDRYQFSIEVRKKAMLASLWPEGSMPPLEDAEKRVREACKLIENETIKNSFINYYLEGVDRQDVAAAITRSQVLITRQVRTVIIFLQNNSRAQSILRGEGDPGIQPGDPITDISMNGHARVKLIKLGVMTVGQLLAEFYELVERGMLSNKQTKHISDAFQKYGLCPEKKQPIDEGLSQGPSAKRNFNLLYSQLYPDQKVDKEEANHRIKRALEHIQKQRAKAIFKQYYFGERTLVEIGLEYKVTRERIRQIINTVHNSLIHTPPCQQELYGYKTSSSVSMSNHVSVLNIPISTIGRLKKHGIQNIAHLIKAINDGVLTSIVGIGRKKVVQFSDMLSKMGIETTPRFSTRKESIVETQIHVANRWFYCKPDSLAAVLGITKYSLLKRAENEAWSYCEQIGVQGGHHKLYRLSELPLDVQKIFADRYSGKMISRFLNCKYKEVNNRAKKEKWPFVENRKNPKLANRYFILQTLPEDIKSAITSVKYLDDAKEAAKASDRFKHTDLTMGEIALIKIIRLKKVNPDDISREILTGKDWNA